jgi:hypothetical protein
MVRRVCALVVVSFFSFLPAATPQRGGSAATETSVSAADEKAVIQSIEDEIYDWRCQLYVEFVGQGIAQGTYQLRVYINPKIDDGRGEVIYKFMPFGEVYRSFWRGRSGLVYLDDTPAQGFGPERPAYKTVYMDDDKLLKDKRDWIKAVFVIRFHPGKDRLNQARERQRARLGKMDYGPHKGCPH